MRRMSMALAVSGVCASGASAHLYFEDIGASGSLSTGWSSVYLANEIRFSFPAATVGDQQLVRMGDAGQVFRAYDHFPGLDLDLGRVIVYGAATGSGTIHVSGNIENVETLASVATFDFTLDSTTTFPFQIEFPLVPITHHVRVNGLVMLSAPDTGGADLARLDEVRYYLRNTVPTPGTACVLAGAGLRAARRRRRAR